MRLAQLVREARRRGWIPAPEPKPRGWIPAPEPKPRVDFCIAA